MTTPTGAITAADINTELSRTAGTAVILNGSRERLLGNSFPNTGIPYSGTQFSYNDLKGKTKLKYTTNIYPSSWAIRDTGNQTVGWGQNGNNFYFGSPDVGDWLSDSVDLRFDCSNHYMASNWAGVNAILFLKMTGVGYDYRGNGFDIHPIPFGNTLGPGNGPSPSDNYGNPDLTMGTSVPYNIEGPCNITVDLPMGSTSDKPNKWGWAMSNWFSGTYVNNISLIASGYNAGFPVYGKLYTTECYLQLSAYI